MGNSYTKEKIKHFPKEIYLDRQKDIKVVFKQDEKNNLTFEISAPNIKSERLLKNIQRFVAGKYNKEEKTVNGLLQETFTEGVFELEFEKFKSISIDFNTMDVLYPKIPNALKTLMCQKDRIEFRQLDYFIENNEIKTDLHSHYTAMLEPEKLMALGIKQNIDYPIAYAYALGLDFPPEKQAEIEEQIQKENGQELLDKIKENKGNWKKIEEIFLKNKIAVKPVKLSELITGEPNKQKASNFQKIMESLALPKEHQNTFTDMKDTYANRSPFTNMWGKGFNQEFYNNALESSAISDDVKEILEKMHDDLDSPDFKDNNLQEDMMLWIARNAREDGIDYIEMSHNALANEKNQRYLQTYDKIMEKMEKETGTQLRFLVGISRSSSINKFKENYGHIKESLQSKYVVGMDILGEETNATQKVEKILAHMTQYALNNDPDMVIRVHAGETNSFDANVAKTIEIVYGEYLKKLQACKTQEEKDKIEKPNLRIGHGIHGLDQETQIVEPNSSLGRIMKGLQEQGVYKNQDKTDTEKMNLLDFMAEMDTIIIERCMTSNTLLSHQSVPGKDPIKEYLKHRIKCVIATDGPGVYGTSPQEELAFATTSGINRRDYKQIRNAEEFVMARSRRRERWIESKNRELEQDEELADILTGDITESEPEEQIEVSILDEFPNEYENSIIISGGSFNKYDKNGDYIHSEVSQQDEIILRKLLDVVQPEKNVLVIGDRLEAQEKLLVELAFQKNQELLNAGKSTFKIVILTKEADELSADIKEQANQYGIDIYESGEKEELENYKKLEKEVFGEDKSSDLLVFDGYQQADNLIISANKGKNNRIFYGRESINESLDDQRKVLENVETVDTEEKIQKSFKKRGFEDCMEDDKSRISSEQNATHMVKEEASPNKENAKDIEEARV